MKSQIRIQIPLESSDLAFESTLYSDGAKWSVSVQNNIATIISHKQYEIPDNEDPTKWMELDRKLNNKIHKTIGHFRKCFYFAYGLTMEWGFEAWYGTTHANDTLGLFPSIHQEGMHTNFRKEYLDTANLIFEDVANTRNSFAKTMLGYWRRGHELSDLGFHSEAFLNFFKALECLEALDENQPIQDQFLDRFVPFEKGKPKPKRMPLKYIRKHVGSYPADDSVVKHVKKAVRILATANTSPGMSSGFFMFVLDIIHARNNYNVGHKILRINPFDTFMGLGQHSDEFEHVIPNLSNIQTLSKMLILSYLFPKKYEYDGKEHEWRLRQTK